MPEGRATDDVLQRLTSRSALHKFGHLAQLVIVRGRARGEPTARHLQNRRHDCVGVRLRAGHPGCC